MVAGLPARGHGAGASRDAIGVVVRLGARGLGIRGHAREGYHAA
ncbi:Hypothetical protein CAP_6799 [Chondromyces apiculatus DSM 436]|uniref:Uncharacterized protein n=1 Tax=Chondromyces apiculatus DSM 436 TaxID=1192034 RepID=A0A017TFR6_9BACT|nr:Hypothetical protein CAP_6799 [Chondromyces apiculatus DSM 436]